MRALAFQIAIFVFAGMSVGCSTEPPSVNNPKPTEPVAQPASQARTPDSPAKTEPRLVKLDLSSFGLPLTIDAPEGAKAEKPFSYVKVTKGDEFGLNVSEGKEDLADLKKEFLANGALKDKKNLEESDSVLLYEFVVSGFDVKVYYFFTNVKVGDKDYHITNRLAHINTTKNKETIELLRNCAKSLAAKPKQ